MPLSNKITAALPSNKNDFWGKIDELKKQDQNKKAPANPNESKEQDQQKKIQQTAKEIHALKNEINEKISPEIFQDLLSSIVNYSADNLIGFLKQVKEKIQATEKAQEFLEENLDFKLQVETAIGEMATVSPAEKHKEDIYERMMFGQKNRIKVQLFEFLRDNIKNPQLKKVAQEFVDEKLKELLALDGDKNGKLSYYEILSKDPEKRKMIEGIFDNAPFAAQMQEKDFFDFDNPNVKANVEKKQAFVSDYLVKFATSLIDPATSKAVNGSGIRFARLLRTITLTVTGGRFLHKNDLSASWNKILLENEDVAKVYNEGKADGEKKKFEDLLAKSHEDIEKARIDLDQEMLKTAALDKANPYGFGLRKVGSLTSIFLYFGKDILFGAIGLGLVMSGFNPITMMQDPIVLGAIAASFGITKYYNPESFTGTPEIKKIEQEGLKTDYEKAPLPVRNWLTKFKKTDLADDEVIGKLLLEKGRNEITSEELKNILRQRKGSVIPSGVIEAGSTEAKTVFQLFKACKQREVSPSEIDKKND